MTKHELNQELSYFSYQMNSILEKLNENYIMINEKYGQDDGELLLEGFWDTLKAGARGINKIANKVGGAVGSAVKGANWLWDKGVELGQKATSLITSLAEKIGGYIKNAYDYIISAPAKFKSYMTELWTSLKKNLEELKTTAGEKYQELVKTIGENIAKKIITPLKEKWDNFKENYQKSKQQLVADANSLKEMGNSFAKSGKENLVKVGQAILKGAESVGFFALGLLLLPFYGVYKGTEFLYNLGDKIVSNVKENLPEVWETLQVKQEFKAGFEKNRQDVKESKVLNFQQFLNENNK